MSNSTPRAALPPLPAPVGRLLHYHGRDTYPKQGYTVARTWEECMKNAYVDYWREGTYLYTAEQVEQIRRETVQVRAALCAAEQAENRALAKGSKTPMYDWMADGAGLCRGAILALLEGPK